MSMTITTVISMVVCMALIHSSISKMVTIEEQSGQSINNMVEAAVAGCIVQRLEKDTLNTPAFE
jgi:hypothetical protein